MERSSQHHHTTAAHAGHRKDSNLNGSHASNAPTSSGSNKKWSFGRLFRRKKDVASDSSSEEDRKAGFVPHQQRQPTRGAASVGGSSANLRPKSNKANKVSRSGKLNGASFDHIVVNSQLSGGPPSTPPHPPPPAHVDHEFFLPVETISPSEAYYQNQQQYLQHGAPQAGYTRSSNSLDRRAARAALKMRSAQRLPYEAALGAHSSSEEELISLNSSTFSKYRSDESIHSGGQGIVGNGQSRRSRAARNERYYKRLSRDGEPSSGQVPVMYAPQPTQRWKTQPVPLSIYNPAAPPPTAAAAAAATPRLRNTGSLQHVAPYVQWGQLQQQPKNLQNTVNDSKRSISYDSHIHLQNINGRLQTKPLPPPPPPRDPLRRVNVSGQTQNGSSGDLRPISYAFDQSGLPTLPAPSQRLGGRCVSDDKIWSGPAGPHYQSMHSLNMQTSNGAQPPNAPHHRRFITRAERDAQPGKKSLPNGIEFHYVADATPRSRKPIHMMEPQLDSGDKEPPTAGILRTTKSGMPAPSSTSAKQMHVNDFWKRMDAGAQRRGRDGDRAYVAESGTKTRSISSSRVGEMRAYPIPVYSEVLKPNKKALQPPPQPGVDEVDNIVCGSLHIKSKPDAANANYVEIRNKDYNKSSSMPNHYQRRSGEIPNTPNKYDEYVAEKREQHHKPIYTPPTPPQRKLSIPPSNVAELPIYFPRKKPANLEEAINELEAIYKSLGLTEEPEKAEKPEKKERIPTPIEFEKYALAHAHEYDEEDSPSGEPDPIRDDVAYRNMQLANLQHKTVEKQPPFGIPIGPVVAAPQNDYLHVTPIVEAPLKPVKKTPDVVKDDLAVRALRKDPPGPKDTFIYPYSSCQKKNRATRTQSANIYNLIHRDAAKPSGGDLHSYLELTRNLERAGSMSDLHKDDGERAADVPATLALLRNLKEQEQQQEEQCVIPKKVAIPFRHPSQGGAICALPEKLPTSNPQHKEELHKAPVPLPRKSLTPEPTAANAQMEDALNRIAMDAQEKSVKLTKELQELRKEALITAAARPKPPSAEEEKLEKDLQEIEAVSEAAKRCGKMLLDTLPDASENQALAKPRKLHKEGKLIEAIDQVSEAANAVCEKILKDIVTTEPPVVVQEAVQVKNNQTPTETLVMPNLIKKLDPIQSEQIEAIAKRCMRQLSALADDNPDYDNLNQDFNQQQQSEAVTAKAAKATAVACNAEHIQLESAPKVDNLISTVAEMAQVHNAQNLHIEEIDQIMQECEEQMRAEVGKTAPTAARPVVVSERTLAATRHLSAAPSTKSSSGDDHTTAPSISSYSNSNNSSGSNNVGAVKTGTSTTASSFSSSSDCLAKSSSPSASGRRQSSSITSFNPYSSSDYIKSPSSEYHAPSTDPIKTFSTTSYEVPSTTSVGATTNKSATTNSTFSHSPSPPLNLPPVSEQAVAVPSSRASAARQSQERARTRSFSSPSQYNSSEELAMIFGIDEQPRRQRAHERQHANEVQQQQQPASVRTVSGKGEVVNKSSVHVSSQAASSNSHASGAHATTTTTATMLDIATTTTTTTTIFTTANSSQLLNTNHNVVAIGRANEIPKPRDTNKKETLNVIVVVDENAKADVEDMTTTNPSTLCKTTLHSTISLTTVNPTSITLNSINTKNSTTSLSPSSCKLASIPENQSDDTSECSSLKLSSNFNKIYASKISIVVDGLRAESTKDVNLIASTQCDSTSSSCDEETSSNPDSGNVSLADYPLMLTQSNNAYLHLENACNSRFEVKKKKTNFVSEISIERDNASFEDKTRNKSQCPRKTKTEDFPPPPTEEELLDSLRGVNILVETFEKAFPEQHEFKEEIQAKKSVSLKTTGECEAADIGNNSKPETRDDLLNQFVSPGNAALTLDDISASENCIRHSNGEELSFVENNESEVGSLKEHGDGHSSEESVIGEEIYDYEEGEEPYLDASIATENSSSHQSQEEHNFVETNMAGKLYSGKPKESLRANTLETRIAQNEITKSTERKSRSTEMLKDEQLIELAHLVRSSSGSRKSSLCSTKDADVKDTTTEEYNYSSSARISTELDQLRLAFAELLERNLTDLDELPRIDEEDDVEASTNIGVESQALEQELTISNKDTHETPQRKQSIVYETPPLELSICDVKFNYTPEDEPLSRSSTQSQRTQYNAEVGQLNEAPQSTPRKSLVEKEKFNGLASMESSLLPWRRRHDNELSDAVEDGDEKPSTSAAANQRRALSIFGELRPAAAAAAATTSSLTTLEHVSLACSLGVITPTDLYTLCLIIIGMITIIAIVLF
ncbi:unnamed protein product [Ceratitis capitata]|uniref:(Mediterranean fruit fly) hypothetical protein n=1 Tax=Ceratitis capitata TaxID=7213 RepID=A0A811UZL7_CERCA|nr:unnamed protein product [Ceratitis capitata]